MNEAFRLLFDQVQSGVVWVERNGTVRYANKAAVQLTPVMLGQRSAAPLVSSFTNRQLVKGDAGLKLPS